MICLYLFDLNFSIPPFSRKQPEFPVWTRDARYYAKGVGFHATFVSDPPQYVTIGKLDTENYVRVDRGYSRECVHMHALA